MRAAHLNSEQVGSPDHQAGAVAETAAGLGLVQGFCHTPPVVQQSPPVHHDLHLPGSQGGSTLTSVHQHTQLRQVVVLLKEFFTFKSLTLY